MQKHDIYSSPVLHSPPCMWWPPSVLLPWVTSMGNIGVWTVGHSHSGLDLERASSFIRPTYSWLHTLPASLRVRWKFSCLEAGPTMIVTQRKLGNRS